VPKETFQKKGEQQEKETRKEDWEINE
jgi:hypothetical protein